MIVYHVIVYCRDCTGEDPQGCFDGGSEELFSILMVVQRGMIRTCLSRRENRLRR